ncbi:hypothetical protein EZ428_11225 [Pedobacter frigiditerrae]|uniref:Uncharacterized protein n=1 Tax=Pedobacter frigiditerrae TaxID=2530452 RepID=A0A4R0MYD5_9SPHI|nr:hypothetical protein [Pedobacter frigiditerrae]TCC92290.1 hypothetical protein EZ428_11225 [Pedobacter frigiditerrae]
MPDKEFDKLFKDKLADAEIEPSVNLWANIEQQLEPKRKRTIPIYWIAAASVAVAITAMLVFQKTDKIRLRGSEATAVVLKPVVEQDPIATTVTASSTLPVVNQTSKESNVANSTVKTPVVKAQENSTPENNVKNIQEPVQPMYANNRLPIKQQDVKPLDVAPVKDIDYGDNQVVTAKVDGQSTGVETSANEEIVTERKGIRNVGDLVNFVVEKVDKRDKKLVRFNTDDDDNSSIIGINIGFLKLNSKKHNK